MTNHEEHTFYFDVSDETKDGKVEYWCANDIDEYDSFIGMLLLKERLFFNSTVTGSGVRLLVLCNDVFYWGCADAEEIQYDEIPTLFQYYTKDPHFGIDMWVITKRKLMPQKPIYDLIQKTGIWDLDKIKGLEPNETWPKK